MGACSGYMGEMRRAGAKDMTKKADLVGAMKAAAAECEKAYGSFKDAQASDMIEGRRGKRSRIGTLYGNVIHIEHRIRPDGRTPAREWRRAAVVRRPPLVPVPPEL
ncbi:MAG: hypothetical protein R2724_17570 [Bryobacterales bacterium]